MDMVKQEGPVKLEVLTQDGAVKLMASMSQSVGGGSAAGVMSAKASVELDVGAAQGVDLACALLKAHFPSLAMEIDALDALAKGQLAKV
jgi:hypothetical protein